MSNKRQYEDSPQRPKKRRRSESPSEDLRDTSSFVTVCSHFSDSTGNFHSMDNSRKSTSSSVSADAEEKKSRKRPSEESPDRPSKRSRLSQSPSEDLNPQTNKSSSSVSADAEEKKSRKRQSEESPDRPSKRSRLSQSPSEDLNPQTNKSSSSAGSEEKKSRKRQSEESPGRPSKRNRLSQSPSKDLNHLTTTESSSSAGSEEKKSRKRKSEESPERPSKRSRLSQTSSEDLTQQTTTESSSRAGSSSTDNSAEEELRAKYTKERRLGKGGYGEVFAGHRIEDNLPVAIKYIEEYATIIVSMDGGCFRKLPREVALLQHLKPAEGETSTVVSLLDWYLVDEKLILVLERPEPCMDLWDYMRCKKSSMKEDDVKILAKQLLDCLIDVHSKGVFHRDIKPENILIETGSPDPRFRLIDFGCGTFVTRGRYTDTTGTKRYLSPEHFTRGWYTPKPSSVWQLGVVLFETLHKRCRPFNNTSEICRKELTYKDDLSSDCKDFLQRCLTKTPEERATMETLRDHPWLTSQDSSEASTSSKASPTTKDDTDHHL